MNRIVPPPGGTAIYSYVLFHLKYLLLLPCYLSNHFQSVRTQRALHLPYNLYYHQNSLPHSLSPTGFLGYSIKSNAIFKECLSPERRASTLKALSVLKLLTVKLWRTHRGTSNIQKNPTQFFTARVIKHCSGLPRLHPWSQPKPGPWSWAICFSCSGLGHGGWTRQPPQVPSKFSDSVILQLLGCILNSSIYINLNPLPNASSHQIIIYQ